MKKIILYLSIIFVFNPWNGFAQKKTSTTVYHEQFRPQVHFSPMQKWMNDPNGLVYFNKIYHLFFQYYPDSTIWGPMHWGHAISKDLVHWKQQPIALYPDSLGYIYSGSVIVDSANTSGFGKDGIIPLVAIFTHSNPIRRKEGKNNYQYQSLAYSLDDGHSWTKYAGNPVLKNPGIKDFRDPKVRWFKPSKRWIMTLATKDRVTFYSSADLKEWVKESEFGQELGAHGGVWECPDLFPLDYKGQTIWVLLVSVNPGGPNGGSATQYFVGNFDGKNFVAHDSSTRWIDYGTDDYAGVTWSNTGERRIFIGWMSNWQYANKVPTLSWRSAMTLPRELNIEKVNRNYLLISKPIDEFNKLKSNVIVFKNIILKKEFDLSEKIKKPEDQFQISISWEQLKHFDILFSNSMGEELVVGYDKNANQFFIDRTRSGETEFEKDFAKKITAPRLSHKEKGKLTLVMDASSVELFADDGLTVMTAIFFPHEIYNAIKITSSNNFLITKLEYWRLKGIW